MELSTLCALPRQIRKVDDEVGLAAIEDDVEAILQARIAGSAAREEDTSDLPALIAAAQRVDNLIHLRRVVLAANAGPTGPIA
jgi:hypothetical protein